MEKFCESLKESRAIENTPANELDLLLSTFFISVRKQNVQPNFVAQLSGHKNLKSLDSYHSASLKHLFAFLFGHIINILLPQLGRSVWENRDLGRWYRPHCVRSVLATSVKILPYKPPARLIRAK